MTHDRDQHCENVPPYVLGALSELEAEVFERHIMGCSACRDEVAALRPAADALALAVPQLEAPETLRRSLMDEIREEATDAPARASRRRWPRLAMPRLVQSPAFVAAAAAGLLVVSALGGFGAARLSEEPDLRTIAAKVDGERLPSTTASLVIQGKGEQGGQLRVQGLPATIGDQVYQVWLKRGDELIPGPLFSASHDGTGTAAVPAHIEDVDAVMVTRERAGGARVPSERPVIEVAIS